MPKSTAWGKSWAGDKCKPTKPPTGQLLHQLEVRDSSVVKTLDFQPWEPWYESGSRWVMVGADCEYDLCAYIPGSTAPAPTNALEIKDGDDEAFFKKLE